MHCCDHEYFHEWFDLEAEGATTHPRSLHAPDIYFSLNFYLYLYFVENIFTMRTVLGIWEGV